MENIITLVIVLAFIYFVDLNRAKAEKERFNEFTKSVKQEPKKEEDLGMLPQQDDVENEFVDLDEVDPEQLIKHLNGDN